ncbi:hypothetical protein JW964_15740, partial [candidate division KSB1 bacterium]|nr:hypothetical protein [candidate division KSB1 bacterium]
GIIAVGVVGLDGLGLAHIKKNPDVDMELADAQLALVLKLVQKSINQLTIDKIEDNLITTQNLYILTLFLGEGAHFLNIIADKQHSSLGNIKLMAHQFAKIIEKEIPGRRGYMGIRESVKIEVDNHG